jgi:hypothetical protein
MQAIRRALSFWLTCVLAVGCVAAFDTFILRSIEPDFGGPFGNFSTVLGIYAILSLPAAFFHGAAAFLLRRALATVRPAGQLIASSISAIAFLILFYILASVRLEIPARLLLLPSAIAFAVSLLVLAAACAVSSMGQQGAA